MGMLFVQSQLMKENAVFTVTRKKWECCILSYEEGMGMYAVSSVTGKIWECCLLSHREEIEILLPKPQGKLGNTLS